MTGPVLRPWKGARRDPRFLSDAARYKQAGNAVAVPVVAEAAEALTGEQQRPARGDGDSAPHPLAALPPAEPR